MDYRLRFKVKTPKNGRFSKIHLTEMPLRACGSPIDHQLRTRTDLMDIDARIGQHSDGVKRS